jgi:hypothetical protein
MVRSTDGINDDLRVQWHRRLLEAQARYKAHPSAESGAEWSRLLRVFADLVLRNKIPKEEA